MEYAPLEVKSDDHRRSEQDVRDRIQLYSVWLRRLWAVAFIAGLGFVGFVPLAINVEAFPDVFQMTARIAGAMFAVGCLTFFAGLFCFIRRDQISRAPHRH